MTSQRQMDQQSCQGLSSTGFAVGIFFGASQDTELNLYLQFILVVTESENPTNTHMRAHTQAFYLMPFCVRPLWPNTNMIILSSLHISILHIS